ncbi:MAG: DUF3307 domain-containing protein [Mangrovibacterium sp.]
MILFLRLLLAHLIADFLLQPSSWVNDKIQKKIKSKKLFFHVLVVTGLSTLFTLDFFSWKIPVFIFILHYATDLAKIYLKPRKMNNLSWFLIDQAVHIIIIYLISASVNPESTPFVKIQESLTVTPKALAYIVAYFIIIWPSMVIINLATRNWQRQIAESNEPNLVNAGKWIGVLERVLVLTFIIAGQFQAIGFLIAAKSILRLPVKNEANARVLSEYVLIGTLISFAIAVFVGVGVTNLVQ